MDKIFNEYKDKNTKILKALDKDNKPKEIITQLSNQVLQSYDNKALIDKYKIYQILMTY